ncbi:MAG: O-antigen ligase family protein [Candidatus Aminicenantes bacterium]|nr:O-antigen ligase family protein [Candidatus Aminicenantes bacterium]
MAKTLKSKLLLLFLILVYIVGFCLFYYKYVPLIKSFQMALIPFLFIIIALTALNVEWGILFFAFSFPLINNLPYFFGIYGHIPHAPTALVLFLAFFAGWLINNLFSDSEIDFNYPVFKPLLLLSLILLVSGIITFFRYANFFPFISSNIYELTVNVNGVSAGGALMSNLFSFLNYFTGFCVFFILINHIKTRSFIKKVLIVLSASALISLSFSLVQKYISISLGNMPFWVSLRQINSTFKDPNAFGVILAAFFPVLIGMAFALRKGLRLFPIGLIILSLFVFPSIGSRSGLLGLGVSVLTFFILFLITSRMKLKKKIIVTVSFILVFVLLSGAFLMGSKQASLHKRMGWSLNVLSNKISLRQLFTGRLDFWKAASCMVKDYPLTGVGIGAYIVELPNYSKLMGMGFRNTDSAENYFIQAGAELGLIGLLLVLWLFYEVIRQLRRSWKESLADNLGLGDNLSDNTGKNGGKDKYILIGIISGIICIFTNFLFHSYIGSYDVKYFFWLLVALVFACSMKKEKTEVRRRLNPELKIAAIILVLIFGAAHLWNSTHSLSLKSRTEQLGLVQDFGFYEAEKDQSGMDFRWTKSYGGTTIKIEKPVIEIPLLASHPDIREKPVEVEIYIVKDFFKHKKLLGKLTLKQSAWKTYEYSIPDEVGEEVILLFKVSRTWNPLKTFGTPDPRNLGVAIGKIQFKENMGKEGRN